MKILITGGNGFIGTYLVKKLLNINPYHHILIIDNHSSSQYNTFDNSSSVKVINDSTININNIDKCINFKPDICFHFGEYSRINSSFNDMDKIINSNICGTGQVLEYCRIHDVKLIYSASSSVYDTEANTTNSNPYTLSKIRNIELIKKYNEWYGLKYILLFFYNVYGGGQITNGSMATVIGIFEEQFKQDEPLTVVSPGTQMRDFTHIEDTINAIIIILDANLWNTDYNINTGQQYSILDIAKMFNNHNIKMVEKDNVNRMNSSGNNLNLTNLGWKPKYNIQEYIHNLTKKKRKNKRKTINV